MRRKKILYNVITNVLLQLIIIVYGFVVPRIIIGEFGSEVNGLIASITQFLAYITLLESGFGPVVKAALYRPIAKKDKTEITNILKVSEIIFRKIAYIFIGYILILCILFPLIVEKSFDAFFTVSLILIIGISTFAEYFFGMTYRLFLQARQKTYVVSIIQALTYLLSIILVVFLAKINASIQIIKLASGLAFVLRPLIQNYYVRKKYDINLSGASGKYEIKQKWDALAQHVASVIHGNTDITVLTLFATLMDVSVYSVYYLVVSGVRKVVQSFCLGIDASFGDMLAKGEEKNLRKNFSLYESIYFMIVTIVFASALVLITPFVIAYTQGVTDANYIRPVFGSILVIGEFIWSIRQPYNELIKAAGRFKETRKGALVEAGLNIFVSIILVHFLGIVGVAIGTAIAMLIRTVELVYHVNRYILKRSILVNIKKFVLVISGTVLIVLLSQYLPFLNNTSYLNWITNAVMVLALATSIVMVFSLIFCKKDLVNVMTFFKSILKRRKGK